MNDNSTNNQWKNKDVTDEDDDHIDEDHDNDDDDNGITKVDMDGVCIKTDKNGKTTMVFSGDQSNIAQKMLQNIKSKVKKSKDTELVDFKVSKPIQKKK